MNTNNAVTEAVAPPWRVPTQALRWPAVLGGMVVGIAAQLLLMVVGVAAGLSGTDNAAGSSAIPLVAGVWKAASLLVSALVGGYVAARSTGFRRTGDGVLHGVVCWGATTILFAVLATTEAGTALGGLFGLLAPAPPVSAGQAGAWLGAGLSLAAGIGGGAWGVRGARRLTRRSLPAMGVAPPSTADVAPALARDGGGPRTSRAAHETTPRPSM